MKYKFFDHTADAKFQAYGKTIEEAFMNAGLAMGSIMIDPDKVKTTIEKQINVTGIDLKAILYDYLEELLFLLDTEGFILGKFLGLKIIKNKKTNNYELEALVLGDTQIENYKIVGEVKAITYNDMDIINNGDEKVIVQVVVDM